MEYLDEISSRGKYSFTAIEAATALSVSKKNILSLVKYHRSKGRIVSPIKGMYCYLPTHYRNIGCLPASQLVPLVMDHLGATYYTCLLSASSFYGAEHHKVQKFQVMADKRERDIICGRVKVEFFYKKVIDKNFIKKFRVDTGYINVSTPELTMLELVRKVAYCGGIDNVSTVISELIEEVKIQNIVDVIKSSSMTELQRLGYILDNIKTLQEKKKMEVIDLLSKKMQKNRLFYTPLSSGNPVKNFPKSKKWRIIENTTIQIDT